MSDQRFTPASALDRDFVWHGEGEWTGLAVPLGQDVLLRAPFFLPAQWKSSLHERGTPLYLNSGYPLTLTQEVAFTLPESLHPTRPPEPLGEAREPLRWRVEWRHEDRQLEAHLEIVLRQGDLDWDDTLAFRESLRRLYDALEQGVVLATR